MIIDKFYLPIIPRFLDIEKHGFYGIIGFYTKNCGIV